MADSPHNPRCSAPSISKRKIRKNSFPGNFDLTISELNRVQGRFPHTNPPPLSPNEPPFSIVQPEQEGRVLPGPVQQPVKLIWRKQQDTINNYVTYFDNLDSPCKLEWDTTDEVYSSLVHLTCGEHQGCLALSDRDLTSEIDSFSVFEKSHIQSVTLSIVKSEIATGLVRGKQATSVKFGEKKREGEELRKTREEKGKLDKELKSITAQLQKEKESSEIYKKEIISLREQLDDLKKSNKNYSDVAAGQRNEAKIRELNLESEIKKLKRPDLDEDNQNTFWKHFEAASNNPLPAKAAPKGSNYVNFDTLTQYSEYYTEYKELEKSKNNLSKAKKESEIKAAKLLDFLHQERKRLDTELTQTKEELFEAKNEIAKLKEHRPPLPNRSHIALPPPPAYQQQYLMPNYK